MALTFLGWCASVLTVSLVSGLVLVRLMPRPLPARAENEPCFQFLEGAAVPSAWVNEQRSGHLRS